MFVSCTVWKLSRYFEFRYQKRRYDFEARLLSLLVTRTETQQSPIDRPGLFVHCKQRGSYSSYRESKKTMDRGNYYTAGLFGNSHGVSSFVTKSDNTIWRYNFSRCSLLGQVHNLQVHNLATDPCSLYAHSKRRSLHSFYRRLKKTIVSREIYYSIVPFENSLYFEFRYQKRQHE